MNNYRAAVIGCGRMGAFIDNEVIDVPGHVPPYGHTAVFTACDRTDLIACAPPYGPASDRNPWTLIATGANIGCVPLQLDRDLPPGRPRYHA